MLDLLRQRFVRPGNGGSGEYAFLTHVRNAAGFDANRTFDAISMSLWPSRGLELHAFEVKCSRSDWLRELKNPAKAEAAAHLCDRFWLVLSDEAILAPGELPPEWGLLVARGEKLACVKEPGLLSDPKRPVPRSFLVSLLRAGGAVPSAEADEVRIARAEGYQEGKESAEAALAAFREDRDRLRVAVNEFEQAAGVSLCGWAADRDPASVGAALRTILQGEREAARIRDQIAAAQRRLRDAADELDRYLTDE